MATCKIQSSSGSGSVSVMDASSESETMKSSQIGARSASSGVVMEVADEVGFDGRDEADALAEVKEESALGS